MTDKKTLHRLRNIWHAMKNRCHTPTYPNFKNYGANGVTVCSEWRNSFQAFADWALSSGYSHDLTVDRIGDGTTYSPATCRWATRTQQSQNRKKRRGGSSKYVGVFSSGGRHLARIKKAGVTTQLGSFKDEEEAARAYDAAAVELYGPDAKVNFPRKATA